VGTTTFSILATRNSDPRLAAQMQLAWEVGTWARRQEGKTHRGLALAQTKFRREIHRLNHSKKRN